MSQDHSRLVAMGIRKGPNLKRDAKYYPSYPTEAVVKVVS